MIYFKDHEIKVRDIIAEDSTYLFTWRIDKEVNKHDPRPLPKNCKELLEVCKDYCNRFQKEIMNENIDERKYKYFIITNHCDKPIGFINLFSVDSKKKQAEMGVIIGDKRYWQRGIAYKAVNEVIDYIFANLDIDRIVIETGENNLAALKLFEKLDFNRCDAYIEEEKFKFSVMEKIRVS